MNNIETRKIVAAQQYALDNMSDVSHLTKLRNAWLDGFNTAEENKYVCTIKGIDLYLGDKVRVKGTKKVGIYETEIINVLQGYTLKENKTYLSDNKCFISIIEKI